MRIQAVNGQDWTYEDTGGLGVPIVAIHGLASSRLAWAELVGEIGSKRRVLTVDLPGYSLENEAGLTLPSIPVLAFQLETFLSEIGVERFLLLGHSFGAAVALQVAAIFPEQVSGLILIAPGGFGPEVNPVVALLGTRIGQALLGFSHRPVIERAARRAAARQRKAGNPNGIRADEALNTYEALRTRAAREQLRRSVRGARQANTSEARALVGGLSSGIPLLVIWGEKDLVLPLWQLDNVQRHLPWAEIMVVAGAGHTPHRSNPRQTAARIGQFLASND